MSPGHPVELAAVDGDDAWAAPALAGIQHLTLFPIPRIAVPPPARGARGRGGLRRARWLARETNESMLSIGSRGTRLRALVRLQVSSVARRRGRRARYIVPGLPSPRTPRRQRPFLSCSAADLSTTWQRPESTSPHSPRSSPSASLARWMELRSWQMHCLRKSATMFVEGSSTC